ncbi:MAG: hypothetical protein OXU27_08050 [Candidatus Poribacteria bacterium]|nr:hypothetical protein [Candidatus Poribacteria bacterium]
MTNTLTWNIRFPIQLPKLNTNLISVISLLVLCMMILVTINTAAEACEELKLAVAVAKLAADAAIAAAELAFKALERATEIGNEGLIFLATKAVEFAISVATVAVDNHVRLAEKLRDCLENTSSLSQLS